MDLGNARRQEDDIVQECVLELQRLGWRVLASGAIQGTFRVALSNGTVKAPDMVAFRSGTLLVGEAKQTARGIFKSSQRELSDHEVISAIVTDDATRQRAIGRAESILQAQGVFDAVHTVKGVLAAGTAFRDMADAVASPDVWCVEVDAAGAFHCTQGGGTRN